MCKAKLKPGEQKVLDLFNQGKSIDAIAAKLGLKPSSVQTYLRRARKKMAAVDPEPCKLVVKKSKAKTKTAIKSDPIEEVAVNILPEGDVSPEDAELKVLLEKSESLEVIAKEKLKDRDSKLKRCKNFSEFTAMMGTVPVLSKTAKGRIQEFKDVYCKVCIYPSRCNECPTKILMDKYFTE